MHALATTTRTGDTKRSAIMLPMSANDEPGYVRLDARRLRDDGRDHGSDVARAHCMMAAKSESAAQRRDIGVLLFGGDWACAHGDAAGLADVANQLARRMRGTTAADARRVARLCRVEPELAVRGWIDLHERLHGRSTTGLQRRG